MKKLLIFGMLTGLIMVSCSNQSAQSEGNEHADMASASFSDTDLSGSETKPEKTVTKEEVSETAVEHRGVVKLDKEKFLKEVVNYEANPNEWLYQGELPALIDFYADWCRPCQITSPIIDELAEEYAGKIQVYKIDVQNEQELAAAFGIQSIPSFLYIPMDDRPVMSMGIAQTPEQTKEMFKQQIDEILLKQ